MSHDEALKQYEAKVVRENLYGPGGPGEVGVKQTREGYYFDCYRRFRWWGMSENDAHAMAEDYANEWRGG